MTPHSSLDQLPTKDGFRLRGLDMTRTETFTDAAFAFAVTLLVISVDAIPSSYDELIAALGGVPAFALSFALLMLFWHGHWSWSRRYGLEDGPTIVLSCALVFLVLCYVYPLRMIFSGMVAFFTGGALGSGFTLEGAGQLYRLFVVYSLGFVGMSAVIVLLHVHAYRRREKLGLDELEIFDTFGAIRAWTIVGGAGVLSIVLALVTPPSALALPGWAYAPLAIVMPLFGVREQRERDRRFGKRSA